MYIVYIYIYTYIYYILSDCGLCCMFTLRYNIKYLLLHITNSVASGKSRVLFVGSKGVSEQSLHRPTQLDSSAVACRSGNETYTVLCGV